MPVIILRGGFQATRKGFRQFGMDEIEPRLHLAQCNQGEDRLRVLVGAQRGIGPKLVSGFEKPPRQVLKINGHWFPPISIRPSEGGR